MLDKKSALKLKRWRFSLLVLLIIINILLLGTWLQTRKSHILSAVEDKTQGKIYPEVEEIRNQQNSFSDLKKFFQKLAEQKGAQYAYEVLKIAPMPPNTDMHLMGHVVGDILYKQQGASGIKICTDDFRNACSHSIVVGLLLDKGEGVLPEIAKACKQAPGGMGAYTMCYHGLGHGVLAYTDYDLPEAVKLCAKTSTNDHKSPEAIQCIGGTIMEIISGGDHDKNLWSKMRKNYLKPEDPLSPCFAEFMPKEAQVMCLTYLTPYLWEAVGADIGNPNETDHKNAFKICNTIPAPDKRNRDTCFGGFGKEFTTLANNRDIRTIDQMTDRQLTKVYRWCQLAEDESGIQACLSHALSSLFWGGENEFDVSIRFCNLASSLYKASCFDNLIESVSFYVQDPEYRKRFCESVPVNFKEKCQLLLLNN